ncbi:MAG: glycosyltransferase [Deltaproteobacteria bacterium]|nr:glycosyltransferase [Deltaproteobacteria bacterium]
MVSIPNGVDIDLFQAPVDRNEVRAEFGISPDAMVIGTVANFREVKNHVCLLKALDILSKSHPELRVLLVGRGFPDDSENSEPGIRRLINELGIEDRVIFAGYRGDIPRILRAFDIFCLPSLSEGLPVSILEAMAAHVPVVGSDVRGIQGGYTAG